MGQSDSVTQKDIELLRSVPVSDRGLTTAQAEGLRAVADKLAEVVRLPAEEHAVRLPQLLTVPDIDLLRACASSIQQSESDRSAMPGDTPGQVTQQLDALALKLASYLPPRNGG
jgi:hypothetical protein